MSSYYRTPVTLGGIKTQVQGLQLTDKNSYTSTADIIFVDHYMTSTISVWVYYSVIHPKGYY